jgi:hypothetical protein
MGRRAYIPIVYRQYQFEHGSLAEILNGKKKLGKAVQNQDDVILVLGKPFVR